MSAPETLAEVLGALEEVTRASSALIAGELSLSSLRTERRAAMARARELGASYGAIAKAAGLNHTEYVRRELGVA